MVRPTKTKHIKLPPGIQTIPESIQRRLQSNLPKERQQSNSKRQVAESTAATPARRDKLHYSDFRSRKKGTKDTSKVPDTLHSPTCSRWEKILVIEGEM